MMALLNRYPRAVIAGLLGLGILAVNAICLGAIHSLASADNILHLPLLSSWRHIPRIYSSDFMMFSEGQFRPSAYALLALLRSLVDADSTMFWHLLLLCCHWLNAFIIASIVRHFARSAASGLFAGLLFAVHPLAAVLVTEISLFHHLMGLTLFLATFWVYLRADLADHQHRRWHYILSVFLFLLGLTVSKLLFALPCMLFACEIHRRLGWRQAAMRLLPFVVLGLAVAPVWWLLRPHPLHYSYILFPPGATWSTLYSVISATQAYVGGLLFGVGIPVPLHEVVPQIYDLSDWRLIGLAIFIVAVMTAGLALLRRRHWGGLGLVALLVVMAPYASTTWNSVLDYVAWKYIYAALAGLALFLGWAIDELHLKQGRIRWLGVALWLCLPAFAWQQVQINRVSTSSVTYWTHVTDMNPGSESANVALGRALLDQGEEERAREHLFAPAVKQLYASAAALCAYHTRRGELVLAAIHLRMAIRRGSGLQFGYAEPLMAELMHVAQAYDHAEAALGKVLTANPYDIAAMERLAAIWGTKGYIKAAEKLLLRAAQLAPESGEVARMRLALQARRAGGGDMATLIDPPSPSWLRYATQGFQDGIIREAVVSNSLNYPTDPVVQLEAATCLAKDGMYPAAKERLDRATAILPESAFAWAMRSWVAAELDSLEEAIAAGRLALKLDNRNATVHNTLGILVDRLAEERPDGEFLRGRAIEHFREALRINPQHASAYVNLAKALRRQGSTDEALALYRRVLRLRPDLAEAHFNMGNLFADQGDDRQAVKCYLKAIRAKTDYLEAYFNLGVSQLSLGEDDGASASFRKSLQLKAEFTVARDALATVLIRQRLFGEAISVLKEGLMVTPRHARGALMLASLLATSPDTRLRDGALAVTIAERVCNARDNKDGDALLVLARAREETGDIDGALVAAMLASRNSRSPRIRVQAEAVRGRLSSRSSR
jgi:Tfp pilus assembly protein PilF